MSTKNTFDIRSLIKTQPPLFYLAVGFGVIFLLGLGTWQMQRLAWKTDILDAIAEKEAGEPRQLPIGAIDRHEWEFRPVAVTGRFDHTAEHRLVSRIYNGRVGQHVLTPFETDKGEVIIVNRGFVPNVVKGITLPKGEIDITGVLHMVDDKNAFTPDNTEGDTDMYWTDPLHIMAMIEGDTLKTEMILFETAPEMAEGAAVEMSYPIAGQFQKDIPNNHLGYAVFWYSMALILCIMSYIYVIRTAREGAQKGRKKKKSGK